MGFIVDRISDIVSFHEKDIQIVDKEMAEDIKTEHLKGGINVQVNRKNAQSAEVIPDEKIDITNSDDFKKILLELFDEGYKYITIDFGDVTGIDSSGLGKLLLFQKKLTEVNGQLNIVNVNNDYVSKMFKMIHLDKVINIHEGEQN